MNPKIEAIVQSVLTSPLMRGSDIRCWSLLKHIEKLLCLSPCYPARSGAS